MCTHSWLGAVDCCPVASSSGCPTPSPPPSSTTSSPSSSISVACESKCELTSAAKGWSSGQIGDGSALGESTSRGCTVKSAEETGTSEAAVTTSQSSSD